MKHILEIFKCGFTLAWTFTPLSGEWLVPSVSALKSSWQDDRCSHVCQHQGHKAWKHSLLSHSFTHTHKNKPHCVMLWSVIKYSMKKDTNASGKVMSSAYKVRTQLHNHFLSVWSHSNDLWWMIHGNICFCCACACIHTGGPWTITLSYHTEVSKILFYC